MHSLSFCFAVNHDLLKRLILSEQGLKHDVCSMYGLPTKQMSAAVGTLVCFSICKLRADMIWSTPMVTSNGKISGDAHRI